MVFKLLALNIDGTLLQPNGSLTKVTRDAIQFVREKDVYVTLLTSRNFPAAQKVAKTLRIPNSILVTHGGSIIGSDIDKPLIAKRMTAMRTFQIVQALEFYDCNIRIVHERFSYANRRKLDVNLIASAVVSKGDPVFYPIQFFDSLSDVLRDEDVCAPTIDAFFDDPKEKWEAFYTIQRSFPDVSCIPVNDLKFEIVPKGVSKMWGLQQVSKELGIALSEMVVIGDSLDDREAIENVGLGVAMWNAPTEVKKSSDWVTRSNEENGVAYVVREHFRKQQRIEFVRHMSRKQ